MAAKQADGAVLHRDRRAQQPRVVVAVEVEIRGALDANTSGATSASSADHHSSGCCSRLPSHDERLRVERRRCARATRMSAAFSVLVIHLARSTIVSSTSSSEIVDETAAATSLSAAISSVGRRRVGVAASEVHQSPHARGSELAGQLRHAAAVGHGGVRPCHGAASADPSGSYARSDGRPRASVISGLYPARHGRTWCARC